MSDWKELELGNIPSDFFTGDYEVELRNGKYSKKTEIVSFSSFADKLDIIKGLHCSWFYRYRTTPLRPIEIDKLAARVLVQHDGYQVDNKTNKNTWNGREVIIID